MKRIFGILVIGALAQGCALTDASLEIDTSTIELSSGPLSDATTTAFLVGAIEDAREDVTRVGYKKNGFGKNMGDVATAQPVTELIREALANGLEKNGHTVAGGDVDISGVLTKFWLDTDINFTHIEILCNVDAKFVFEDSGGVFYERNYSTTYSDKFQTGMESNMQKVISGAIAALVDEVTFDEDLVEALDSR